MGKDTEDIQRIEQRKQELLARLQEMQRENPRCLWLKLAVYMNNQDNSRSCSNEEQG
jgi:hypothetical protein